MFLFRFKPLSEVRKELTKKQLEQDISELEISQMEQEQVITDHDIAIMELQEKVGETEE